MRGMINGLANPYPLVTSLPSAYQEDLFTDRFLSVFDDVLAPVLATLDNIEAYLDPWLCPPDFLPWMASWVGVEIDENWSEEQQRRLVATAVDLLQWGGTRRGTVDLIRAFLGIEADRIDVEDSGGVAWSVTPGAALPGTSPPTVTVRVRADAEGDVDERRLERLVRMSEPAHVATTVEVVTHGRRGARAGSEEPAADDAAARHDGDPPADDRDGDQSAKEREEDA